MSTGLPSAAIGIPVFASIPSKLDEEQKRSRDYVYYWLRRVGLEPRTVGVSDESYRNPMHEVRTLARHCAGGLILGYWQTHAEQATVKVRAGGGGGFTTQIVADYYAPTPWNHLETGVLFGLGLPLLVLKQEGISGGIFDEGASDVFVKAMPMPPTSWSTSQPTQVSQSFESVLARWQALVMHRYYDEETR